MVTVEVLRVFTDDNGAHDRPGSVKIAATDSSPPAGGLISSVGC